MPKATGTEEPRSKPLVPLICLPIFAKRSWRFWAQELENVWLFVQCLKSQTFSNSCAQNRHDLLAKIVGEVDGTKCGELCCYKRWALVCFTLMDDVVHCQKKLDEMLYLSHKASKYLLYWRRKLLPPTLLSQRVLSRMEETSMSKVAIFCNFWFN